MIKGLDAGDSNVATRNIEATIPYQLAILKTD